MVPLLLIHQKTKQRYPLRGDFVIGRSKGDLIFDHDPKLSSKHCLIRQSDSGFAIYDLKSRTGVHVNGSALPAGKACVLKSGLHIVIGDQEFLVRTDRRRLEKLSARAAALPLSSMAFGAVCGLGTLIFLFGSHSRANTPPPPRPQVSAPTLPQLQSINAELQEAVRHYQEFERSRANLRPEQAVQVLKQDVIPRLSSVHNELQAYRSQPGQNASRIDLERRMAGIYLGQAVALAGFLETNDEHFASELTQYKQEMNLLKAALAELNKD